MIHFIMLKEGDLIAVSEIKRIRNRQDGFTDVWLKGETQSHIAHISFGEMVDQIERCYQIMGNAGIDTTKTNAKVGIDWGTKDETRVFPVRPPREPPMHNQFPSEPKRHFPPIPGENE
jgi:hypothetical protein